VDATIAFPLLVGLIAVALLFDFLNGLHDAANSIATIVSTRVLRPQYAVLWAAFFNFVAFLVFGLHVANTIGTGIIAPDIITPAVIFAALVGAIAIIERKELYELLEDAIDRCQDAADVIQGIVIEHV
jgi:PiT family inorganic phosphate transporter